MKDKFEIGEVVRTECTAIGRYIGKGMALYVSAMSNDLCQSRAVIKDPNEYDLPLPGMKDVRIAAGITKHKCPTCRC